MADTIALIILAAVLAARETLHYYELRRRDTQVADLLNRIRPETAQPLPGAPIEPDRPAVDLYDDEDWQRHREELTSGRTT